MTTAKDFARHATRRSQIMQNESHAGQAKAEGQSIEFDSRADVTTRKVAKLLVANDWRLVHYPETRASKAGYSLTKANHYAREVSTRVGNWLVDTRAVLRDAEQESRHMTTYTKAPADVQPTPVVDVTVVSHGSLHLFTPSTDAVANAMRALVQPDAQWFGRALVVEPRYSSGMVSQLESEGLVVALL